MQLSIIDEIHEIERNVESIKAVGRKEIKVIYDAGAKKELEMSDYFLERYKDDAKNLEQDMLDRVFEYEAALNSSFVDNTLVLTEVLKKHEDKIARLLVKEFWGI